MSPPEEQAGPGGVKQEQIDNDDMDVDDDDDDM